jgi:hypothetical protein
MLSQVIIANDLTLVVGNEAVRLTPSEGFHLAERLIRKPTSKMVADEVASSTNQANRRQPIRTIFEDRPDFEFNSTWSDQSSRQLTGSSAASITAAVSLE